MKEFIEGEENGRNWELSEASLAEAIDNEAV
jgi:hypothetical protein